MKIIRCPHCQSVCETGSGYYHDDRLNIRCKKCNRVILATSEDDEKDLHRLYTRPVRDHHDNHHLPHHYSAGMAGQNQHRAQHQQHYPGGDSHPAFPLEQSGERDDYD